MLNDLLIGFLTFRCCAFCIKGHGNQLISIESDKLGKLYLYLKDPIDAILLQVNFDFPPCIVVDEDPYYGVIIRDIKNSLNIQQFKSI